MEATVGLFGDLPSVEVPLIDPPLVRVLAQVRFPTASTLAMVEGRHELSRRLRSEYPVLREQHALNLTFTPQGIAPESGTTKIWQLHDRGGTWTVSITESFVTIDTTAYVSRKDLCARLGHILNAIQEVAEPVLHDRIGVRYINQLSDENLTRMDQLVRTELLGGWALARSSRFAELSHAVSESVFSWGDDRLLMRWAVLPPGTTVEPSIQPLDKVSWILDLDSFSDESGDFDSSRIVARMEGLADVAYRGFRLSVTDEYIRQFSEGAR